MKNFFILFTTFFMLMQMKSFAQINLVPNGDFEVYDSCPYFISSTNYNLGINLATPWFQPNNNGNSTDYFNACDTTYNIMGIPFNYEGYQLAHSGVGYAGFSTGAITLFDPIREYLEIQLTNTLITGNKYCVEMYVSHANFSDRSTDNISTFFSSNATSGTNYLRLNFVPQINSPIGVVIDDTLNWVQVYGEYIANGGERFMTIGNFSTDSNTTLAFNTYGTHPYAYYYIDDVSVIDCTNTGIPDNYLSENLELYPNPVKDLLTVEFGNAGSSFHNLSLSDLTGKIILQKHLTSEKEIQLDLSAYPPGMYFLRVEDGRGKVTKKLIKL